MSTNYALHYVTLSRTRVIASGVRGILGCALLMAATFQSAAVQSERKVALLATHPEKNTQSRSSQQQDDNLNRLLRCIFNQVGLDIDIYHIPWARAKRELSRSAIDGIFLTNIDENVAGVKTKPIYLEKWFALSNQDTILALSEHRIGVIRGSDIAHWLNERGVSAHIVANNYGQLIDQFRADRFDLFIADINLLMRADYATGVVEKLNRQFIRYMAKGVTFSTDFIKANPSLLSEFNSTIKTCNPAITEVNSIETGIIRDFVKHQILTRVSDSLLSDAHSVAKHFQEMSDELILSRDKAWRNAVEQRTQDPFIDALMNNAVSVQLRQISQETKGISEIFLTDNNGVLLGTSTLLSDYYQGDEEKVRSLAHQQWSLTNIEYDESSGDFITHYSTRLEVKKGQSLILIVGVDLEDVFRGDDIETVKRVRSVH